MIVEYPSKVILGIELYYMAMPWEKIFKRLSKDDDFLEKFTSYTSHQENIKKILKSKSYYKLNKYIDLVRVLNFWLNSYDEFKMFEIFRSIVDYKNEKSQEFMYLHLTFKLQYVAIDHHYDFTDCYCYDLSSLKKVVDPDNITIFQLILKKLDQEIREPIMYAVPWQR